MNKKHHIFLLFAFTLLASTGSPALGQITAWDNTGTGDWTDPANWTDGVPAANTETNIALPGGGTAQLNGVNGVSGDLRVGNGGILEITNGAVLDSVTADSQGHNIADGSVLIDDATWNVTNTASVLSLIVGNSTSGPGTITLTNGGRLDANSNNGVIVLTSTASTTGTVNIGNGGAPGLIRAGIVDGGAGTAVVNFNHIDSNYFFFVRLTGDLSVNQTGSGFGTTILGEPNSYTGGTTVTTGVLELSFDTSAGSGDITLGGSGSLRYTDGRNIGNDIVVTGTGNASIQTDTNRTSTHSGNISGSRFGKTGGGTLILSGNNTQDGIDLIDGTVQIDNDSASGSGSISSGSAFGSTAGTLRLSDGVEVGNTLNLFENATIEVAGTDRATFSGATNRVNDVAIIKTGTGTLTLTRDNDYAGLMLDGGTVVLGTDDAGSSFDNITIRGADTTLSYADGINVDNPVDLENDATLEVLAGSAEQSGVISDGGNSFGITKTGNGTLVLSGNNDFTGGININGGTLSVSAQANLGGSANTVFLNGATLLFDNPLPGEFFDNDAVLGAGGGTFQTNIPTGSGNVAAFRGDIGEAGGPATFTKSGEGPLRLFGTGSWTGGTVLEEGSLSQLTPGALPGMNALTVNGDTLLLQFDLEVSELQGTNSGSSIATGSQFVADQTTDTTYAGEIEFGSNGAFIKRGSGQLTLSGVVSPLAGTGGTVTVEGGRLVLTADNTYTGGTTVTGGTLDVDGGGIRHVLEDLVIADGAGAASLLVQNGGQVEVELLMVGEDGNGTLTVDGPGTLVELREQLFIADSNGSVSVATVQNGARLTTEIATIGNDGDGTLVITGAGSEFFATELILGNRNDGIGTLTVTEGGKVTSGGFDFVLAEDSDALATLNIGTGAGAGVIDSNIAVTGGDGTSVVNFNHDEADYHFTDTGAAGGTANTLAGDLNVNHVGPGQTTLSGASTYTGTTTVSDGTLLATNTSGSATGTGAVTVENGGTLGGTGFIGGPVTVLDGGALAPGLSPGTLTINNNLILNNASLMSYELDTPGTPGGGVNDLTVVNGNLTLDGIMDITDLGGFGAGTYRLFDYTGALTDNGLLFGTVPTPFELEVDTTIANQINLTVAAATRQFWDDGQTTANGTIEGGNGTWDAATTNWTNSNGNANAAWAGDLAAVFTTTGGTVTIADGFLAQASGFDFQADGYTIIAAGTGGIEISSANTAFNVGPSLAAEISAPVTGAGGVTKTGTGTLVLTGANSYNGNTTVKMGTLELDGGSINPQVPDNMQTVTVGDLNGDDGTLVVKNGGNVSNFLGLIGHDQGSTGTVTVTGGTSEWINNNALRVGLAGQGTLNIEEGGTVEAAIASLGNDATGVGFATVKDSGSKWTVGGGLDVGDEGSGTLRVENGGLVSSANGSLGNLMDSQGLATVTGAGSEWTMTNDLNVGDVGTGTLNIENGATVSSVTGSIGEDELSNGLATVTGPGSNWTMTGRFEVGNQGAGSLMIENGGMVSNADGIIGDGVDASGMVTVTGGGSVWTNTASLTVGGGNSFSGAGTGTMTAVEGGTVNVDGGNGTVTVADLADSTGTVNIGDGSGAGVLNAAEITTGDGMGSLNFNHTDADYFFTNDGTTGGTAVVISGPTTVNHLAGMTTFNGANTYTGPTNVTGGTLVAANPDALGTGDVNVNTAGVLRVMGPVNVGGDLALNAGGVLSFDVDSGDVLNVAGTADIAGGGLAASGTVNRGDEILLIDSAGLGGDLAAFLIPAGSVLDQTATQLLLIGGSDPALIQAAARTPNEVTVAGMLSPLFTSPDVSPDLEEILSALEDAAAAGNDGTVRLGLNQLAPEELAVIKRMAFAYANTGFRNLQRRGFELRSGARGASLDGLTFFGRDGRLRPTSAPALAGMEDVSLLGLDPKMMEAKPDNRWGFFANGTGQFGDVDSNTDLPGGYDFTTAGVTMGLDYRLARNVVLGLALGYAGSDADTDTLGSSVEADAARFGMYASIFDPQYELKGEGWYIDAYAGGAYNSYDTTRVFNIGGVSRTANGSPDGLEFDGSVIAGYDVKLGSGFMLSPYTGVQYTHVGIDSYTETGGGAINLAVGDTSAESLRSNLGLVLSWSGEAGGITWRPEIRAAWQHEFLDGIETVNSRFASGAGTLFTTRLGDDIADDSAFVGASLNAGFTDTVSAFLSYDAEANPDYLVHSINGGVSFRF